MSRSQEGFTNIPPAAVDALKAADDSLIRKHIFAGEAGLHKFVNFGVAVELQFGLICVCSLTDAPGTI